MLTLLIILVFLRGWSFFGKGCLTDVVVCCFGTILTPEEVFFMAEETKKDVVSEQDGKGNETVKGEQANDTKTDDKKANEKKTGSSEDKKESGFSKWWKGTKAKMDSDMLESHIQNAYGTAHQTFDVYNFDGGIFNGSSVTGEIVDGYLIYWGNDAIKEFSVVVDRKDNKAYYAGKSEPIDVKATYEGTEYTRKGTKSVLDANVEEVKVIKADKRYFLYKGNADEKK